MQPNELLSLAAQIIEQRGANYGGIESNFKLIADIATLKMGREFHPYEICRILECVKDARTFSDPTYLDNDLDGVNYRLFATQFAEDYVAWRQQQGDVFYRTKENLKKVTTASSLRDAVEAPRVTKQARQSTKEFKQQLDQLSDELLDQIRNADAGA